MGLPSEISRKDIMESGRLDYIRRVMKENNISLDNVLHSAIKEDIDTRYGKIQNTITYANTYGKFI